MSNTKEESIEFDIAVRKYDGRWNVWAPYHNEDLSTRWQIVATYESKGKAEKFIKQFRHGHKHGAAPT